MPFKHKWYNVEFLAIIWVKEEAVSCLLEDTFEISYQLSNRG